MQLSVITGATQDSTRFFIPIPPNLTPEGIVVYILASILNQMSGIITDENNNYLTDESGNKITFDNTSLYPEVPLSQWRTIIKGDYELIQIVFKLRTPYAD